MLKVTRPETPFEERSKSTVARKGKNRQHSQRDVAYASHFAMEGDEHVICMVYVYVIASQCPPLAISATWICE